MSLQDFQKVYDPCALPAEMGGTIPMTTMIELWKYELATKRDQVIKLDQMKILSTRDIQSSRNGDQNGNLVIGREISGKGVIGSFRKLEID